MFGAGRVSLNISLVNIGRGGFPALNFFVRWLMNDLCRSIEGVNLPYINASPAFRIAVESGAVVRWSGGNDLAGSHHLLAQYGG